MLQFVLLKKYDQDKNIINKSPSPAYNENKATTTVMPIINITS